MNQGTWRPTNSDGCGGRVSELIGTSPRQVSLRRSQELTWKYGHCDFIILSICGSELIGTSPRQVYFRCIFDKWGESCLRCKYAIKNKVVIKVMYFVPRIIIDAQRVHTMYLTINKVF